MRYVVDAMFEALNSIPGIVDGELAIVDLSCYKSLHADWLSQTFAGILAIHQTLQNEGRFRTPSPRRHSPSKTPDPVEASNCFSDLEQDVEQPIPVNIEHYEETIDKPKPPPPIMLKIKINYGDQIKSLYEKFSNLTFKSSE
ncbi:hypothetical protein TNCV_2888991 [Trichonephila clavipes]|nr:hypothetical protein TNCV_2888991 [Trichonephila clavipes]